MKKNNIQKMPKAGQAGNSTKPNVRRCFSESISEIHFQNREHLTLRLEQLLEELQQKGNVVTEIVYALEMYIGK